MDIFYEEDIETLTNENTDYRRVLYTSSSGKTQLVLMSLKPGEEIGMEKHENADQFIRIEKGSAEVQYGTYENNIATKPLKNGSAILIPANTYHNIINKSDQDLKLYTIYSPPQHKNGLIQHNKTDKNQSHDINDLIYLKKYLNYKKKYLILKSSKPSKPSKY